MEKWDIKGETLRKMSVEKLQKKLNIPDSTPCKTILDYFKNIVARFVPIFKHNQEKYFILRKTKPLYCKNTWL